jgi:5-formyltetrahydrofolate cyclo-ligase
MSEASEAKIALREQLLANRKALSPEEVHELSARICHTLEQSADWAGCRYLHCFDPIVSLNEVDLTPFVQFIMKSFKGIEMYTSRNFNGVWQHTKWHSSESTEDLPPFDAIIVPTLSFDTRRIRLGLGMGYYDQFLAAQPDAKKIGVCFEQGRQEKLPAEPHDVPLDMIITEVGLY